MPLAALIGKHIFVAHGGISEDLLNWNQFKRICPTDVTDIGFISYGPILVTFPGNTLKPHELFGKQATEEFQGKLNVDLIVRGHQVAQEGYEFLHGKKCLTLFSALHYCSELSNKAGILYIDES